MTLTPEQFNRLATKKEFNKFESKVDDIKEATDKILMAVDGLTKKVSDYEAEQASNIVAHGRMQASSAESAGFN